MNAPAARHTLAVLRLLSSRAEPVPAATVAREVGLPRSTTYKLLRVLTEEGFVSHLPEERRYGLGLAAFELGSAYGRQDTLVRLARPVVDSLVRTTTHNGHLAVLHGRDVLYLVETRAPGRPTLVSDVGVRLPAQLTASGLALLAALPQPQVRALFPGASAFVDRHGAGVSTLAELRRELSVVRRRGHAEENGTVTPGLGSVAAAAHDHTGHPSAAVSVTYPADDPTVEIERIAAAVRSAAQALTDRIRGRR